MIAHAPPALVARELVARLELAHVLRSSCGFVSGAFLCHVDLARPRMVGTAGYERRRYVVRVNARREIVRVVLVGAIA